MKKPVFNALLLFTILLFNNGCEKDFSPLNGEVYTSHNFTWEIDTLYAPDALQVNMSDIWGTDENNVWAVGHSDVNKYQAWHWDGSRWENVPLVFWGHPHSLNAIHGFAADDIWIVGTDIQDYPNTRWEDFIIHYDGNDWELINDVDAPWCFSVWGTSSNSLFVGSDSGLILHYDGNIWEKQSTNTSSQIISIWGYFENDVYAGGLHLDKVQPIDSTFYYIYKYNGQNWEILDSALDYPYAPELPFGPNLWGDNRNLLYSAGGDGLFIREQQKWNPVIKGKSLYFVNGSAYNNIFTGGFGNRLYHFNGASWHLFEEFINPNQAFINAWSFREYAFIIGWEAGKSIIYRGKQYD